MKTVLKSITNRDTFMPPPVLPAQAPTNMSMTRIVLHVPGHRLKSVVVLDSFAGSGAVGEAALNLKRNCILIEILKDNIEKIKKRFENNVLMKTAMEW